MATVIETIGTAARDRSTITLWEAAINNTTYPTAGTVAKGECYDDSAFDESVVLNASASNVDEIILSVQANERHDGTAGTGARIVRGTFSDTYILSIEEENISVEWLEVDQNQITGGAAGYTLNGAESANQTNLNWRNMIVHGTRFSSSWSRAILALVNDSGTHNTLNCIVYDVESPGNRDAGGIVTINAGRTTNVLNNTVHDVYTNSNADPAYCFEVFDQALFTCKNNVGTDPVNDGTFGQACYSNSTYSNADVSHNLASDTSASGTGSLDSKASADQFVSTTAGSEDLHLKTGADAIDAGTDLGTTPTGVNIDIDGRDRDAEGDTWDMGADEFVSAASFVPYPNPRYVLAGGMQPAAGGVS